MKGVDFACVCMGKSIEYFLDKIVVVDTDTHWLYVGTLKKIEKEFLILENVDAHNMTESRSTRDEYLVAMKTNGLVINRKQVAVMRGKVVGLSLFGDIRIDS